MTDELPPSFTTDGMDNLYFSSDGDVSLPVPENTGSVTTEFSYTLKKTDEPDAQFIVLPSNSALTFIQQNEGLLSAGEYELTITAKKADGEPVAKTVGFTVQEPMDFYKNILTDSRQFEDRLVFDTAGFGKIDFVEDEIYGKNGVWKYTSTGTAHWGSHIDFSASYNGLFLALKNNYETVALDVLFTNTAYKEFMIWPCNAEVPTLVDTNRLDILELYDASGAPVAYDAIAANVWYTIRIKTENIGMTDLLRFSCPGGGTEDPNVVYISGFRFEGDVENVKAHADNYVYKVGVEAPLSLYRPGVTLKAPSGTDAVVTDGKFTPTETGDYTLTYPTENGTDTLTLTVLNAEEYDKIFINGTQFLAFRVWDGNNASIDYDGTKTVEDRTGVFVYQSDATNYDNRWYQRIGLSATM